MAKKVTIRFDLKSAKKMATVSIHKNSYKVIIDDLNSPFNQKIHYFPKSITSVNEFDADSSNNQFLTNLDVETDKWFADKEGYGEGDLFGDIVAEY